MAELTIPCPFCGGTGQRQEAPCPDCGGDGTKVPAGIHETIYANAYDVQVKTEALLDRTSDILDKVNDIMNKCNDIFEKLGP